MTPATDLAATPDPAPRSLTPMRPIEWLCAVAFLAAVLAAYLLLSSAAEAPSRVPPGPSSSMYEQPGDPSEAS